MTAPVRGRPLWPGSRWWRLAPLLGYITVIVAANWAAAHLGFVPVGGGLTAPAGVYAAGLALTLRDLTHETLGRRATLAAIAAGTALSALGAPRLAVVSGLAFALGELTDLAVYTPLRRRGLLAAVAASNLVGAAIDSAAFLLLAFGNTRLLPGQLVGKAWATAATLVLLWACGLPRRSVPPAVGVTGPGRLGAAVRPTGPGSPLGRQPHQR